MPTKEQILEKLREINDPELNYNIVDLGLVYRVLPKDDGTVEVDITLTSPGCPMGAQIYGDVMEKVSKLPGVKDVQVNIVWDPPWSVEKLTPEIRDELGV